MALYHSLEVWESSAGSGTVCNITAGLTVLYPLMIKIHPTLRALSTKNHYPWSFIFSWPRKAIGTLFKTHHVFI